jgi:hypothetical protein
LFYFLFQPNISAIFPVEAKYPIAPRNNPNAIRFGTIPPIIWAYPRVRKIITTKTRAQLSAKFILTSWQRTKEYDSSH